MRFFRIFVRLYLLLSLSLIAAGQADQSMNFTQPSSIYHGSDFDNVSVPAGNLHQALTLLDLAGRGGLDLQVLASYNSQIWQTTEIPDNTGGGGASYFLTTPTTGGWNLGIPRMGGTGAVLDHCGPGAMDSSGNCTLHTFYLQYGSPEGGVVELPQEGSSQNTLIPVVPTLYWSGGDGTYMRVQNATYDTRTEILQVTKLLFKDGSSLNQHYTAQEAVDYSTVEDTNGNFIKCTWHVFSGTPANGWPDTCTDTLGRSVSFTYGQVGSNAANILPLSIHYLDSSGNSQSISLTWQMFSLAAPWAVGDPNCQLFNHVNQHCSTVEAQQPWPFITQIALANGKTYSFQYVTVTGGAITGEISQVTLPTGGYIKYQYGSPANAISGSGVFGSGNNSRQIIARTVSSDGTSASEKTWVYGHNVAFDNTLGDEETITDPVGNVQASWWPMYLICSTPAARLDFKDSSGNLVKQVLQTLGSDNTSYFDGQVPFPSCNNPRISASTTILSDTNQQSSVTYSYGTFGNVSDVYETDWGSGAPGPRLRHTQYQYLHDANSAYGDLQAHILDRAISKIVRDGFDNQLSKTTTVYDGAAVTATSNVAQHDTANFSTANNVRGNATSVQKWLNTTGGTLTASSTYNDVGNVLSTTDDNGNVTNFSYADNYYNATPPQATSAFPTQVTAPATSGTAHVKRTQYYFNSGLAAAACGENFPSSTTCAFGLIGQPDYKSLTYDGMGRPLVQTTGGGGQTSLTYNEATLPFTIVSSVKLDSAHSVTGTTVYDGLGRTQQTQLNSDPAGADLIDIGYDAAGHQNSVSNPHRSGTAATDGVTQTQYDALGRVTQTTQPDGSVGRVLYSGNCTTATDEAGKSRKSCSDALGRLTSVFEDPAGLNYETDYQYDALGNLLRVDQKGSSPSDSTQWRSRTFTYDSLSRLLTAMNPESGTIGYQYDANGNLTQKTAPAENQTGSATVTTTYAYDALNRLTETSHSDGTPIVLYGYDETSGWGNALVNTIGRVSSATTFKNFGQPYIQGTVFSYDSMGRTINEWECIPSSCAPNFSTYHISAAYDLAGNMTSLTYPDTRVVGFRYNTANRLNQVQFTQYQGAAPPGGTFYYWNAPDANFSPNGTPLLVSLGNPTDENVALNNRLQLQQKSVVSSNLGAFANHVFNYGTSNNNGDLLGVADQISSAYTQTFTYDSLNRLATAGESRWGNSYVYDAWGNFTQQNVSSGSSFSHQFQADGNNRLVGYSYDAAGNLLNDKAHAYIYDGANRLVNVDSGTATYTYDSNGERVRKDTASGSTEYISFGGEIIAERNVSNGLWSDYIFANGKRIAMAYTYDNELHLHGVNCSSCGSQYADFLLPYAQGYNGYVIRSGDKLIFEQYQPTGVHGGMYISFTDGTGMLGQVNDSDGQPVANDGIENVTHFRTVDLSSFAGKTINLVSFHLDPSTAAGAWDLFFDSAVLTSADGSVRPFWTHEETVTLTPGATSGISGLSYEVRKSLGTIPILTTTFYHDDQIGSSRLMTDGFGMPVWQGTFLPYGEEYNSELTANHYKFTGKERDAETGLDYFGARYYSSGVGRFVTPDWAAKAANVPYAEFADPQSLNLYEYVRDIPTTKVDPDGHLVLQQDPQNQSSEQRRKEFDDQEQELEDKIRNFLEKLDNATSFRGWKTGAQIAAEKAAKEAQSRALWGILYPNLAYPEIQIGSVVPLGLGSAARATELADAMGKTKNFVTIAVTETKEGTTIVSSSENALRPAVRGLLREGEVAAEGPGHAEITGARTAEQMGLTPTGTAASRGICQGCWDYLKAAGIKALSALKDKVIP